MDITLQILIDPPAHRVSAEKHAMRERRGDIIAVYRRAEIVEPPAPGTRMGFVHITGVPNAAFRKIKNALSSEVVGQVPSHSVVTRFEYEEMVLTGDYRQFYLPPKTSIAPDIDTRLNAIPENLNAQRAKFVTIKKQTQDKLTGRYVIEGTASALRLDGTVSGEVRARKWRIPPSAMPKAVRNKLKTEREITVDWNTVKPYIRKKIISDRLSRSADDETVTLKNSDVA